MAAAVARPPQLGPSPTTTATTTTTTTTMKVKTARSGSDSSPNRHLPSPPLARHAPRDKFDEGPTPHSPRSSRTTTSLLAPPDTHHHHHHRSTADVPSVGVIDAATLAAALDHAATQPMPETRDVFPWLHGLSPVNDAQLTFFGARRRSSRKAPKALRGITIVKAGGDLTRAKLKGALAPSELISVDPGQEATFNEVDPPQGFSVRNFHIQAVKMATVSDVVVYGDETVTEHQLRRLATRFATAQKARRAQERPTDRGPALFNTYVLTSPSPLPGGGPCWFTVRAPFHADRARLAPFRTIEVEHPNLVAIDWNGQATGKVLDFVEQERIEMCNMSRPSEIAHNVWLGLNPDDHPEPEAVVEEGGYRSRWDVLIETSDVAMYPHPSSLPVGSKFLEVGFHPYRMEFPSSGSTLPSDWTDADMDGLVDMCRWMYRLAHNTSDDDKKLAPKTEDWVDVQHNNDENRGDDGEHSTDHARSAMSSRVPSGRRILIHSADGYTESSFLALAYIMYAEGIAAHEAWLRLHRDRGRNFFAYQPDLAVLLRSQHHLVKASPMAVRTMARTMAGAGADDDDDDKPTCGEIPDWLMRMDGSFPSRILSYLYLGNLNHANNAHMLSQLGIRQVLSVGEPLSWTLSDRLEFAGETMFVSGVQDNGIDPLSAEFGRCLEFIEQGKVKGIATLVHCRVGVSRSATICIAEIMKSLGFSFPRAYCFVRARRLNVIIQPHLRFSYELLKWEETLGQMEQQGQRQPFRRELEWATIAREIAAMNRPYSR